MTIVILPQWFSEKMGYVENHLPKALQKLGCDVHVVTSELQIYATDLEFYNKIYERYLGPGVLEPAVKELNGFTLHRLPHYISRHGIGLNGLQEKLQEIRPDVVYLFEINTEHTLQVVKYKPSIGYKIFSESRIHRSVYNPPATFSQRLRHYFSEELLWKKVGRSFQKVYPVAPDVKYIIEKYFGQEKKKSVLSSLAVDTESLKPIETEEEKSRRTALRTSLELKEDDLLCIYTGRFTDNKGTIILAKAIDYLHTQGKKHIKALFVGTGDVAYEENIKNHQGCTIHPFVESAELVKYYQAADIGIWPKEESTSQLDAASCGLPIIISSQVEDTLRIEGNGLSYQHGDPVDLAKQIEKFENPATRIAMGMAGAEKIRKYYSWDYIARLRLQDFKSS
jgi:glycosyltransferase involved in cell wall biosynthesis